MNKILLYTSLFKDKKLTKTYEIAENLNEIGYEVFVMMHGEYYDTIDFSNKEIENFTFLKSREEVINNGIELVVVLGGDGSLIGYCREYRDLDIPVIGLNIGTLGFLAELSLQNYERIFKDLKEGKIDFTVEERSGLYVEYEALEQERLFAVNEVAIARGTRARIIDVEVYINGIYLDRFNSDGIIVATAIGSTGYNLSAGGPILLPGSSDVIITPICPHSLGARSIIVTKDDIVTLKLVSEARDGEERGFMTIDGQDMYSLKADFLINIKSRKKKLKFAVFDEEVFYRKYREKIK